MTSSQDFDHWLDQVSTGLSDIIAADISRHVALVRSEGGEFYGYAVLPGDPKTQFITDAASIGVAFNRESDINAEKSSDPYYRYSVDEWENYVHEGFENTNVKLRSVVDEYEKMRVEADDAFVWNQYERKLFVRFNVAYLQALQALRGSDVFSAEVFLVIWIPDSATDIHIESSQLLNSEKLHAEFASEFG